MWTVGLLVTAAALGPQWWEYCVSLFIVTDASFYWFWHWSELVQVVNDPVKFYSLSLQNTLKSVYLVGFRTFLTPVSSSELSVFLWQIRNRWKNEYICSLCTYKPLNLVAFSSWSNCSSESYIASKCVIMVITHVCDVICLKKLQLINSAVYRIWKTLPVPHAKHLFCGRGTITSSTF